MSNVESTDSAVNPFPPRVGADGEHCPNRRGTQRGFVGRAPEAAAPQTSGTTPLFSRFDHWIEA